MLIQHPKIFRILGKILLQMRPPLNPPVLHLIPLHFLYITIPIFDEFYQFLVFFSLVVEWIGIDLHWLQDLGGGMVLVEQVVGELAQVLMPEEWLDEIIADYF